MNNLSSPWAAIPLVRMSVMTAHVRVGDYWECGDGCAQRVNQVQAGTEGKRSFQIGSRVGAPVWIAVVASQTIEIRRLKEEP